MKGMVFSAFIEMVEERFSMDVSDQIIEESQLASGGAYTTIGTYDHGEIIALVGRLSAHSGIPESKLLIAFGEYLFPSLVKRHPFLLHGLDNAFDVMRKVDQYIHVEVRKLYPDAQLPVFNYEQPDENTLVMIYSSKRPFADLAEGMISGCIQYFDEHIAMERVDTGDEPGTSARFTMKKRVNGHVG